MASGRTWRRIFWGLKGLSWPLWITYCWIGVGTRVSALLQSVNIGSGASTPHWRCFPGGDADSHLPPSIVMSGAKPPCPRVMSWRVQDTFKFTLIALLLGGWGKPRVMSFELVYLWLYHDHQQDTSDCQGSVLRSSENQSCTWTLHFLISTFSLRWIMGQDVTAFCLYAACEL